MRERRNFEYQLFREHAPSWKQIFAENSAFGIWGKKAQERIKLTD